MNIIDINQKDLDQLQPKEYDAIYDHAKMRERYFDYAKNLQGSKVFTGFSELDKRMNGIRPGEVVSINAPTNAGKSALALNLMYNAASQDAGMVFYFSTELSSHDIFERFVQLHLNISVSEVEAIYANHIKVKDAEVMKVIETLGNIYCVIKKVLPTEIMKYVQFVENVSGRKSRLIIVDHLQGLKLPKAITKTEAIDDTMQYLKEVALHSGLPIILTSHVPRSEAKASTLGLHSGKGSGEIENSSQIVFTLENLRELPEEVKPNFHIEIMQNYARGYIEILKFTAHKTKRGKYKDNWLSLDNRSLKITEINFIDETF